MRIDKPKQLQWIYGLEKNSDALCLLISAHHEPGDRIAAAYNNCLIHLRRENMPESAYVKFCEFNKLMERYARYDKQGGMNFHNRRRASLQKILNAFLDYYFEFNSEYGAAA